MKTPILIASLALILNPAAYSDDALNEVAKGHLRIFLEAKFEEPQPTYADKVRATPGHRVYKALAFRVDWSKEATKDTFEREKLIAGLKNASSRGLREATAKALVNSMQFEVVQKKAGVYTTKPNQPVSTKDGRIRFTLTEGDVLLKCTTRNKDFCLLQMRKINDGWKIVGEYVP